MQITDKEQSQMVLSVLNNIQKELLGQKVTGFNFKKSSGICWHVDHNTPIHTYSGVHEFFLQPVFVEMGLDEIYPVEMQIYHCPEVSSKAYSHSIDLYNPERMSGELRLKLLDDLIQYYSKKVFAEIENYRTISLIESLNRK